MSRRYYHIWLALAFVLATLVLGILSYINIYRPGTFALLSVPSLLAAVFFLVSDRLKQALGYITPYLGAFLYALDKRAEATAILSGIGLLASLIGSVAVLNDFIDKYRYVGLIRETVAAHMSDTDPLPDPKTLAEAFREFPSRSEVPLLLIRTGRIFAHGDNWSKFTEYQAAFINELEDLFDGTALCDLPGGSLDAVVFIAVIKLEASRFRQSDVDFAESVTEAAGKSLSLIDKCDATTERRIVSLLIKDTVNDLKGTLLHDTNLLSKEVADEIEALSPGAASKLMRTHAYQQYLDYVSYKDILLLSADACETDIKLKMTKEIVGEKISNIIRRYRAILSLRSVVGSGGEVLWYSTPGKLNLNRLFMAKGGFSNSINADFNKKVAEITDLQVEVEALIDAPAFKKFQTPDAWFRSTPLDLSLEGQKLKTLIDASLKGGW